MKRIFLSFALLGTVFLSNAQELPTPSPSAKIEQRVGLTDIKIEYSRPSAKSRIVFGELVPYGQLWRTGANMNSTIEFSTDVTIQGQALKAGKYSVFTIPEAGMWTVIFNSKADHPGTVGYSEENDVVRAEAQVSEMNGAVETFTIDINNIGTESAEIVFMWENTKAVLPFEVEVKSLAKENIAMALTEAEEVDKWKVYRNAANYYHNNNIESDKALEYINLSIKGKDDSWYSYWLKAEILAEAKNYKDAVKAAKESKKVGEKVAKETGAEFSYGGMIDAGIAKWSAMK